MTQLGFLGPSGSHSHAAAQQCQAWLRAHADIGPCALVPMMSFGHIFSAVDDGSLTLGCIPIENALEGSVAEVIDGLTMIYPNMTILADFVKPIQHTLIRRYPVMEGIKVVHSHPHALGQCRESLYELLGRNITFIPSPSTSEAVKGLLEMDETHAAIGTPQAAAHYDLDVIVDDITHSDHNVTRFILVAQRDTPMAFKIEPSTPLKSTLSVGVLQDRSGALLELLTVFHRYGLNMSKIESRPTKLHLGTYVFFIDIDGALPEGLLEELGPMTGVLKTHGTYPTLGLMT